MFVDDAHIQPGVLRQGDVLAGVPFPLLDDTTQTLALITAHVAGAELPEIAVATHEHREDPNWFTLQVRARLSFCAVISNCCDLEPRAGRVRLPMIALARLRPIPSDFQTDPARLENLRANRNPADPENPGYLDYFYIQSDARLNNQEWIVHYNQMISFPSTRVATLLQWRVLQMDDRTRRKFKIKLAYSLGRVNDEEIAAGLVDPWAAPPAN